MCVSVQWLHFSLILHFVAFFFYKCDSLYEYKNSFFFSASWENNPYFFIIFETNQNGSAFFKFFQYVFWILKFFYCLRSHKLGGPRLWFCGLKKSTRISLCGFPRMWDRNTSVFLEMIKKNKNWSHDSHNLNTNVIVERKDNIILIIKIMTYFYLLLKKLWRCSDYFFLVW